MALEFRVDILNVDGEVQGSGPLTSLPGWRYTARLDRAGAVDFSVPATDPKATQIALKLRAQGYAVIDGVWVDVGAGVIDHIDRVVDASGTVNMAVSGDDLLRELANRSVGFLEIGTGGSGGSWLNTKTSIRSLLPPGWSLDDSYVEAVPQETIYARFAGESVLAACIKLAAAHQIHFRRGFGRTLEFFSAEVPELGVWNIEGRVKISNLSVVTDTYEFITRIYPYGAGNGRARLTLGPTTRTAPAGYTLALDSTKGWYIENDNATATYGLVERYLEYKEVGVHVNTSSDIVAGANMLFDLALEELRQRSEEITAEVYRVRLADTKTLVRPGDITHIAYRDVAANIDVDATLFVLEATLVVQDNTLRTTDLLVSTVDRWPRSDADTISKQMEQGQIFQAHPQQNANSYYISYVKNMDDATEAEFRFRFDNEILQLVRVLFDFQILQLESTVDGLASGAESTPNTSNNTAGTGITIDSASTDTPSTPNTDDTYDIVSAFGGGSLTNTETAAGDPHKHDMNHYHSLEHSHLSVVLPQHQHPMPHTHDVTVTYGVARDLLANTFVLGDLEYSLDGATWYAFTVGINRYTFLGDNWHRVDLTDLLWDADTFFPLQPDNKLRIRGIAAGQRASIDAQLSIVSVIQAISYD